MTDPRDPLSELTSLVNQYVAEDFVAQRKRLREARMRWIEENECPKPYAVTTQDKDGKQVTFQTPFEIGRLQYPETYNDEWQKEGQRHQDPEAEKELLEGIEAVLSSSSPEKQLTILVTANEQRAFFTGGGEEPLHPPIMEAESYDEYYARVSRLYEQAAGQGDRTHAGRTSPSHDGLRESHPPADPARVGSDDALGDGPDREIGPVLGGDSDTLRPGD
jgi:hypothetical protein